MGYTWDDAKRRKTLDKRGLDFQDCELVFAGPTFSFLDSRFNYGEERTVTIGFLKGRMVAVVHCDRGSDIRIISMRKANGRERKKYEKALG
jgi:uncharacterized DUF497 family protein